MPATGLYEVAPAAYAPPLEEEVAPPPPAPTPVDPGPQPIDAAPVQQAPPAASGPQPVDSAPVQQAPTAGPQPVDAAPVTTGPQPVDSPPPAEPIPTSEQARADLKNTVVDANVLERVQKEGLGGLKDAAGDVAGALGTVITAQGGDIFPYRRLATGELAEMAETPPPAGSMEEKIYTAYGGGTEGEVQETFLTALENDPKVQQANEQGYTDPATGNTFAAGPEAAWEAWVSDKPMWERAFLDIAYDPSSLTALTGGIAKGTSLVAKGARLVDDVVALGANQVVGGGLDVAGKALKKTGILAPTKTQAALTEAELVDEAAGGLGTARRQEGSVAPTVVEDLAPGVIRLGSADPLIDPIVYKTDGRQVLSVIDDPTNLASARPLTSSDNEKLLNLMLRANPEDKAVLMNTGGAKLLQPDATVAQPYLKTLQRSLPSTATGPLRAVVPPPTSGPELLALRSQLTQSVRNGNVNAQQALTGAAMRSGLLPSTTPPTPKGVSDAIGAFESARRGVPLIDPSTLGAVTGILRKRLDDANLGDIGLALDRVITNTATGSPSATIEGQYLNKLITIATDVTGTNDPIELAVRLGEVLDHETIHAVRHLSLFRDVEWRSLSEMARSTKMRGDPTSFLDEVTARYDKAFADGQIPVKLTPEQLEEEAIAEMYRAYMAGTLVASDVQKGLLEKIAAFFRVMVQTIQGARPAQVLSNLETGRIGARKRGPTTTMAAPYTAYRRHSQTPGIPVPGITMATMS
jgi:hypothetical protein